MDLWDITILFFSPVKTLTENMLKIMCTFCEVYMLIHVGLPRKTLAGEGLQGVFA